MAEDRPDVREKISHALHDTLCETCIQRVYPCDEMDDDRDSPYHMGADAVLAALREAGLEIVATAELEWRLAEAAGGHHYDAQRQCCSCGFCSWTPEHIVIMSLRAVVEGRAPKEAT